MNNPTNSGERWHWSKRITRQLTLRHRNKLNRSSLIYVSIASRGKRRGFRWRSLDLGSQNPKWTRKTGTGSSYEMGNEIGLETHEFGLWRVIHVSSLYPRIEEGKKVVEIRTHGVWVGTKRDARHLRHCIHASKALFTLCVNAWYAYKDLLMAVGGWVDLFLAD